MAPSWISKASPVLIAVVLSASRLAALPHPDEPIDPGKRAPISTQDAVRPGATRPSDARIVGDGRIPEARAPVRPSAQPGSNRAMTVSERRTKRVRENNIHKLPEVRQASSLRVATLPEAVPQLEAGRFNKILTGYRAGRTRAADLRHVPAGRTKDKVDLGEINRFANPRATLEKQGIPVVPAGSHPTEETPQPTMPLPLKDSAASSDAAGR